MTAFWTPDPGFDPEDPDVIEVTGFGDPVRSFIPASRDPTPAELAEFRTTWLVESAFIQRGPFGVTILPPEPHGIIHRPREPSPEAGPARCRGGCGLDDLPVNEAGRCTYCADLAALRARNLPGPPRSAWWYLIPAALAVALGTALLYAGLAVLLAG